MTVKIVSKFIKTYHFILYNYLNYGIFIEGILNMLEEDNLLKKH